MEPVAAIIPCKHICSVNDMYEPNKYNKSKVQLTKNARDYKKEIIKELTKIGFRIDGYDDTYALIISIQFVVNSRLTIRDLDNMEKLTIDAIYKYLGLNDNSIYEKHTMKVSTDSDYEFIKFVISQSPRKKSEYVF
jgi:Holliday junction resolvase RusA-like endonuclease